MRLVMTCQFTDGYTYSCQGAFPCEYPSVESAYFDFHEKYLAAKKGNGEFLFAGIEFYTSEFEVGVEYNAPDFITLDKWFESC